VTLAQELGTTLSYFYLLPIHQAFRLFLPSALFLHLSLSTLYIFPISSAVLKLISSVDLLEYFILDLSIYSLFVQDSYHQIISVTVSKCLRPYLFPTFRPQLFFRLFLVFFSSNHLSAIILQLFTPV
jgi:hypothetical protein